MPISPKKKQGVSFVNINVDSVDHSILAEAVGTRVETQVGTSHRLASSLLSGIV